MPNSSHIPVRSSDNRRCYRAGGVPTCGLAIALVVALLGWASFSHSAPLAHPDFDKVPSSACASLSR
jgi:hypothetical protein